MKKYVVITANVLFPGTGSFVAKRMPQGTLQMLFATLAVLLWSTISLRPLAIVSFIFAWLWALFTSLKVKREMELVEQFPISIVERRSLKK